MKVKQNIKTIHTIFANHLIVAACCAEGIMAIISLYPTEAYIVFAIIHLLPYISVVCVARITGSNYTLLFITGILFLSSLFSWLTIATADDGQTAFLLYQKPLIQFMMVAILMITGFPLEVFAMDRVARVYRKRLLIEEVAGVIIALLSIATLVKHYKTVMILLIKDVFIFYVVLLSVCITLGILLNNRYGKYVQ